MAELGSWPSIQKHGLLSTSSLLDLFEVPGATHIELSSDIVRKLSPAAF